jgi:formate-dependent nitrite reductase cytochrome c552 subunit
MHGREPDDQLKPGMLGSAACTQCHGEARFTTRIGEHTFHKVDSSGSECLNCHMPHTTYALLKGIRSHQIESPRVRASARYGVPNACNLCHLDRTRHGPASISSSGTARRGILDGRTAQDVSGFFWL